MERKINLLSISYLAFLFLICLSGMLRGIPSVLVYILSFVVPFFVCAAYLRKNGERILGHFTLGKAAILNTLTLAPITVGLIALISALTSMLIYAVSGQTNDVNVGSSLLVALLLHAIVPTVVEEILFRYLPMRLLSRHSKRLTVLLSSFFFALIHHNLFSIPYAFVAGIVFMSLDLAFDSIWPSIIIHFMNNAVSVLVLFGLGYIAYPALALLSVVSLVIIIAKRADYKKLFAKALKKGEKFKITIELVIFTASTLFIAVMSLF